VAKGRNRKSYRFASVTAEIGMESKAVLDTLSGAFAALVPRRNILLHEAAVTTAARRGTLCSRIGFSAHPGEVFHGSSLRPGSAIGALFCTPTSKAGRGCARRLSDNPSAAGPQVRADMQQYLGKVCIWRKACSNEPQKSGCFANQRGRDLDENLLNHKIFVHRPAHPSGQSDPTVTAEDNSLLFL
jgi:hypothetical protein